MRRRNWVHVAGFALWGALLVLAFVVRPGTGWAADALHAGVPLVLLLAVGGAVLLSNRLRRRF